MALSINMERSYKVFTDLAVNRYLFKRSCNYRLSPTSSTFVVNHQVMSTDLQSDSQEYLILCYVCCNYCCHSD